MLEFTKKFVHLDSTITFVTGNTIDVKNRMAKVEKSMGDLGFIWNSKEVSIETNIKLRETMQVNLLLRGRRIGLVARTMSI